MKLYHATTANAAETILACGFLDGHLTGFGVEIRGVSFAAGPTEATMGSALGSAPDSAAIIEVTVPEGVDLGDYVIEEEGMPVWEWFVPSEVVNTWPRRLVSTWTARGPHEPARARPDRV